MLSAASHDDKISKLIDPALADGRLLPAQKAWAEALGKSDLAALSTYLDTAQPIAALASMQTHGKKPLDNFSGDIVAACKAQWDASAELRGEFASLDDYTAYQKAQSAGLIKTAGTN